MGDEKKQDTADAMEVELADSNDKDHKNMVMDHPMEDAFTDSPRNQPDDDDEGDDKNVQHHEHTVIEEKEASSKNKPKEELHTSQDPPATSEANRSIEDEAFKKVNGGTVDSSTEIEKDSSLFVEDILDDICSVLRAYGSDSAKSDSKTMNADYREWLKRCIPALETFQSHFQGLSRILKTLGTFLQAPNPLLTQEILDAISNLVKEAFPLDLCELYKLLKQSQIQASSIQDQDSLLLIGSSGSGKTSTLLYLAGVEFTEQEVDGSDHYEPSRFPAEELKAFRTACGSTSVTRAIQSFPVQLESGKSILVSDSPGFGDSAGPVMEIVNAMGLCRALQGARSVRPVVVLSCDTLGDRFQALKDTMSTIIRMTGGGNCKDFGAFHYLFTKSMDPRDEKRICKKLNKVLQDLDSSDSWLRPLLADMVRKTTPKALMLSLSSNQGYESSPSSILSHIVASNCVIDDPQSFFSPPFPKVVLGQLQNQLTLNLKLLKGELASQKYMAVMSRVQVLKDLASVLQEGEKASKEAQDIVRQDILYCVDKLNRHVAQIDSCDGDATSLTEKVNVVQADLKTLEAMQHLAEKTAVDSTAMCSDSVKTMFRRIGKEILNLEINPSRYMVDNTLSKKTVIKETLIRMKDVLQRMEGCYGSEGTICIGLEILSRLSSVTGTIVKTARACFASSPPNVTLFFNCLSFVGDLSSSMFEVNSQLASQEQDTNQGTCLATQYQQLVDTVVERINTSKAALLENSRERNSNPLPSNVLLKELEGHRMLLLAVCEHSLVLRNIEATDELSKLVAEFENALVQKLRRATREGEKKLSDIQEHAKTDLSKADQHLSGLIERFSHIERIYGVLSKWLPMFHDDLDEERKHVYDIQASARNLSKSFKDEAKRFAIELERATLICQHFVTELERGGMHRCSLILNDVARAENWMSWQRVLQHGEKINMIERVKEQVKRLFSWNQNRGCNELGQIMDSLTRKLGQFLLQCAFRISREFDASKSSLEMATSLSKTRSNELVLLMGFLKVEVDVPCLAKRIIEQQHDAHRILKDTCESLAYAIESVSKLPDYLIVQMHIQDLVLLLDLWRNSPSLQALDAFAVQPLPRGHYGKELRAKAAVYPHYEDLVSKTKSLIIKLQGEIQTISLCKSSVDVVEHSIVMVCENIAGIVQAAKQASRLKDHMDQKELLSLGTDAVSRAQCETDKIARNLEKMIHLFPKFTVEFSKIQCCLLHLQSVKSVFSSVDGAVASHANALLDDASRHFESKLKNICQQIEPRAYSISRLCFDLKKASRQIPRWRQRIDAFIDDMILKASQASDDRGKFLLDLYFEIISVEGDDASFARQLLLEHKCFEGGQNAIFNSATAKQTIDYVIHRLEMTEGEKASMKHSYDLFKQNYEEIVLESIPILKNRERKHSCLDDIVKATRSTAVDFSIGYEAQLCKMVAYIFAYWSLSKSDALSVAIDNSSEYLVKPHPAQVVAILLLLNSTFNGFQKLGGHLVEIKTGEGKSIVLGVTTIILALFNCEVVCACYSQFLSDRDLNDIKYMFEAFGVHGLVSYSTLMDLGFAVDGNDQTRQLLRGLIQRSDGTLEQSQQRKTTSVNKGSSRLKVLLLDEVDVVFSPEVYGETFLTNMHIHDGLGEEKIKNIFRFIWKHCQERDRNALLSSTEVCQFLETISSDASTLTKETFLHMIDDAICVRQGKHDSSYSIADGRIAYKYFDGTTTRYCYGYRTAFAYMKEAELGNLSSELAGRFMSWKFSFGNVSYAEVPFLYDVILGVTGTLKDLKIEAKNVLETDYRIEKYSYIPSVYGNNKLKFSGDSEQGTSSLFSWSCLRSLTKLTESCVLDRRVSLRYRG